LLALFEKRWTSSDIRRFNDISSAGQVSHISFVDPDATKLEQYINSILGNGTSSNGKADDGAGGSGKVGIDLPYCLISLT
jgi:hypothetical protein